MHTYKYLPINFPAVFKSIVEKVQVNINDEVLVPNGFQSLNFIHGSWNYIIGYLSEQSRVNVDRFPLVALVHDFEESFTAERKEGNLVCRVVIANLANPNMRSDQRYSQNFVPILYPIYAELLQVIKTSSYFDGYKANIKHTKIEHLHWKENNGNALNEFLDGIEIRGMELSPNLPKCIAPTFLASLPEQEGHQT
jgi:hypothetical protein